MIAEAIWLMATLYHRCAHYAIFQFFLSIWQRKEQQTNNDGRRHLIELQHFIILYHLSKSKSIPCWLINVKYNALPISVIYRRSSVAEMVALAPFYEPVKKSSVKKPDGQTHNSKNN